MTQQQEPERELKSAKHAREEDGLDIQSEPDDELSFLEKLFI